MDLVKSYFRLGFSNKEILCLLAHQHGVIISKRTLQRLCRKLNLFRRKNQTDIEEMSSFVQSEMATSGRLQGYRWLHLRAIRRGYVVSQETMRMVIKEIDPEGVELRRAASTSAGVPTRCGIMAYSETSSAPKFNSFRVDFFDHFRD